MPNPGISRELAEQAVAAVEVCYKDGFLPSGAPSALREAARRLGIAETSIYGRLKAAKRQYGLEPVQHAPDPLAVPTAPEPPPFAIKHVPPPASSVGHSWDLLSLPDNTYRFAAFGDLHAGSRYCRYDVRESLTRRAEDFGAQCIFDTGNWIDGEKSFNRHDLEAVGLERQCALLAERYPRSTIPTFAVTGADHEGWYVKSEGINVGRYAESLMRAEGHDWTDLGYMEADILLTNANSGAQTILRVVHPGGGTGYAISYRPQKIIESYEGGEKPAVLLMGHYHKLDVGLVRNVWYVQTGCGQDQTPFMRQKAIEAHVGGVIVEMEQDPETGAIVRFCPNVIRYFNRSFYFKEGRANGRWSGHGPVKAAPRRVNSTT